jgi:hypothetical protein
MAITTVSELSLLNKRDYDGIGAGVGHAPEGSSIVDELYSTQEKVNELVEGLAEVKDQLGLEVLADPGTVQAIPVTRSAYVRFTIGAGAETNTLAAPTFAGQRLHLSTAVQGAGTRAVTCATGVNAAGNTVLTFAQLADMIVLEAVYVGAALRWRVILNEGVTLS